MYSLSYVVAVGAGHLAVVGILHFFRDFPGRSGGLKNAGAAIGMLERAVALTLVLVGEYTAIAFLFTAKSIARFNELKQREFAEYYLIGTLSSILVSLIVGLLTRMALGILCR
jgi:hypothetical protein